MSPQSESRKSIRLFRLQAYRQIAAYQIPVENFENFIEYIVVTDTVNTDSGNNCGNAVVTVGEKGGSGTQLLILSGVFIGLLVLIKVINFVCIKKKL